MDEIIRFYRLIQEGRGPQPADRSAGGSLPTRAFRYCEPVTTASGFGWYLFPPCELAFRWDGTSIKWRLNGEYVGRLESAQYPGLSRRFDKIAPSESKGFAPPFVTKAALEPGTIQVWTGLFARTAPDWSVLIRSPANIPRPPGYELYEGVIETDRWFGPLLSVLRLTTSDVWVLLPADIPFVQVQPLPRAAYLQRGWSCVENMSDWAPDDWTHYYEAVVRPNITPSRGRGEYAVATRQRRSERETTQDRPRDKSRVRLSTMEPLNGPID
jgi:hypothetical protein